MNHQDLSLKQLVDLGLKIEKDASLTHSRVDSGRMRTVMNCFTIKELVSWFISHNPSFTNKEALSIVSQLANSKIIIPVDIFQRINHIKDDTTLFRINPEVSANKIPFLNQLYFGFLQVEVVSVRYFRPREFRTSFFSREPVKMKMSSPNLYVEIEVGGQNQRTSTKFSSTTATFSELFAFNNIPSNEILKIRVKDRTTLLTKSILAGSLNLRLAEIPNKTTEKSFLLGLSSNSSIELPNNQSSTQSNNFDFETFSNVTNLPIVSPQFPFPSPEIVLRISFVVPNQIIPENPSFLSPTNTLSLDSNSSNIINNNNIPQNPPLSSILQNNNFSSSLSSCSSSAIIPISGPGLQELQKKMKSNQDLQEEKLIHLNSSISSIQSSLSKDTPNNNNNNNNDNHYSEILFNKKNEIEDLSNLESDTSSSLSFKLEPNFLSNSSKTNSILNDKYKEYIDFPSSLTTTTTSIISHSFGNMNQLRELFELSTDEPLYFECSAALFKHVHHFGKIFLFENFFCFYANTLGIKIKEKISWDQIISIQKQNLLFFLVPGITLQTKEKKIIIQNLSSLSQKVFDLMNEFWRKTLEKKIKNSLVQTNNQNEINFLNSKETNEDLTKKSSFVVLQKISSKKDQGDEKDSPNEVIVENSKNLNKNLKKISSKESEEEEEDLFVCNFNDELSFELIQENSDEKKKNLDEFNNQLINSHFESFIQEKKNCNFVDFNSLFFGVEMKEIFQFFLCQNFRIFMKKIFNSTDQISKKILFGKKYQNVCIGPWVKVKGKSEFIRNIFYFIPGTEENKKIFSFDKNCEKNDENLKYFSIDFQGTRVSEFEKIQFISQRKQKKINQNENIVIDNKNLIEDQKKELKQNEILSEKNSSKKETQQGDFDSNSIEKKYKKEENICSNETIVVFQKSCCFLDLKDKFPPLLDSKNVYQQLNNTDTVPNFISTIIISQKKIQKEEFVLNKNFKPIEIKFYSGIQLPFPIENSKENSQNFSLIENLFHQINLSFARDWEKFVRENIFFGEEKLDNSLEKEEENNLSIFDEKNPVLLENNNQIEVIEENQSFHLEEFDVSNFSQFFERNLVSIVQGKGTINYLFFPTFFLLFVFFKFIFSLI